MRRRELNAKCLDWNKCYFNKERSLEGTERDLLMYKTVFSGVYRFDSDGPSQQNGIQAMMLISATAQTTIIKAAW